MTHAALDPATTTMRRLFGSPRALIGMLHLRALPGAPLHAQPIDEIAGTAVAEARLYREQGFDALMIENMHDLPYLRGDVAPETVAAMAVIGREVRREVALPLGVQVLAGANLAALAVAHACGATFIRAEAFVFAHVADEGWLEASAGPLLRARRAMGADGIAIFADVKKKHAAHAVTADVDLAETARAAVFNLADGLIVTGTATGEPARAADVETVRDAVAVPTLVGSGISPDNIERYSAAHGFIVGSSVKQGGLWLNALDPARVRAMSEAFRAKVASR